jgi:hypothetical protein
MDHDSLRQELASLRRQVRVLQALLVCALLLSGLSLWQARRHGPAEPPADAEPEVLVGRSVYLRERPGEPYVRLKYFQEGAGLILADAEGRGQVHLLAAPARGRLLLGTTSPRLELDSDLAGPSLTIRDGDGRRRIVLAAGAIPRVTLLDAEGRTCLELSASAGGGTLSLADDKGRPRARLAAQAGAVRLRLLGERGETVFEAPR